MSLVSVVVIQCDREHLIKATTVTIIFQQRTYPTLYFPINSNLRDYFLTFYLHDKIFQVTFSFM